MFRIAAKLPQVFVAAVAGSAGGVTITRTRSGTSIQARRRGVLARGLPPAYWRKVYGTVEELWNALPDVDKVTWLYGWKKGGNTGRDEFGHWNMNLVGRWGRWLRRRPNVQGVERRKTDYPGSEPVPALFLGCLPGSWLYFNGNPPVVSAEQRYATATAGSVAAAWAAAWAALLAKPWTPQGVWLGHNYGFVGGSGMTYTGYAYQGRSTLAIGPMGGYTWSGMRLNLVNGYALGGAVDLPWGFGSYVFPTGKRNWDWPDIRAFTVNSLAVPPFRDMGNWDPPAAPAARYAYKGWYVGTCLLSYNWRH